MAPGAAQSFDRDDIQACSTVYERLCHSDVVDCGGTHQRDGSHRLGGLGVVMGVESDRILRPLEGLGSLKAGEGSVDRSSVLLEVVVRPRRLSSAEDTRRDSFGSLVVLGCGENFKIYP